MRNFEIRSGLDCTCPSVGCPKIILALQMQQRIRWIDLRELVFKRRIGEGGYGIVDEHEWQGRRVAVKTLAWEGRKILELEAALLTKVQRHPNVVEFIGCAFNEQQNKGMLVMELLSEDLRSLIDKRLRGQRRGAAPFPLNVSVDMMRQMAAGLLHLRQLRVLHRDLKSLNILVNPRPSSRETYYDVKLSDFGRSKCNEQDSRFYSVVAPPSWRAPEVFRDVDMASSAYTWSSDVYSFGMVCYEILSGDVPFQDLSVEGLREAICNGERPELPTSCPEDLLKLIGECWATNPDDRPVISDVHRRLLAIAM